MKYLFPLLFFTSFGALAGNSFISWDESQLVTDGTTYFNNRPRIVLTTGNIPVIIWGKTSTGAVYVSRLDGSDFSLPIKLNPTGTEAFVSDWAGPEIASKNDTLFVVFKLLPEASRPVYIIRSTDGGATFEDTVSVDNLQNHQSRFPSVSVGNGGNPIVTFMKFHSNWIDPQYAITRSLDGGQTFEPDTSGTYLAPGEVCDCCPAAITSSGNYHVLSFRNNDNNLRDAWIALSSNNGESFNVAGDIDDNGWMIFSCPSSGPESIISGNAIYTVWMSGASGLARVFIGKSNMNATPLDTNLLINGNVPNTVNQNYPKIAGNGDTIGIVWHETNLGGSFIMFKHSVAGIAGLSQVDTIAAKSNNSLKNPEISYANGTFHIVYQEDQGRKVLYRKGQVMDTTTTGGFIPEVTSNIKIVPNPFYDHTLITWNNNDLVKYVELFDLTGVKLREYDFSSGVLKIEKGRLKPGLYIARVVTPSQTFTRKLIIQ